MPEKFENKENNEARLELILALQEELGSSLEQIAGPIYETEDYTGIGQPIGWSTVENSPMVSNQLKFLIALSKHPLVESYIQCHLYKPERSDQKRFFKDLVDNKILSGLKILDLGCGRAPTFARMARCMGAEVFTVDKLGSNEFEFYGENFDKASRDAEIQNHIQVDLEDPKIVNIIKEKTGSEFDLVTEAHLKTDYFLNGKDIAISVLKQGGIYYDAGPAGEKPEIRE